MKKRVVSFGVLSLAFASVFAQTEEKKVTELDEVVVTDSRFALKRENSGKTVIKVTSKEIEKYQGRTLAELINTKSGIEINGGRSGAGQNLGIYIRGGRSRQVLVLIDGVQAADASLINGEYDLRLLDLSTVKSVEIIKGAASTLYGSGAASAVISITTKKGAQERIAASINSSFGTYQTEDDQNYNIAAISNAVNIGGTLNKFTYNTSFNHQNVDGFSAAKSTTNEKDPFSNFGYGLKLGYQFSDAFSVDVFGNITKLNSHYDGGAFTDAANVFISEQKRAGLSSTYKYKNGSIVVNAAFSDYNREVEGTYPSENEASNLVLDVFNKYNFNDQFYTVIGVNYIDNKTEFAKEEESTVVDPYINAVFVSDFGFNLNAGVRFNNHSEYGSHLTYSANPSYVIKTDASYVKFFGSYATSFITPSLSQLFGNFGPNPDLEPEENTTIEGGVSYNAGKKLRASVLYFTRDEDNVIGYGQDGYANIADTAKSNGFEVEISSEFIENLNFNINYTFTERKDENPLRIPKHKVNLNLGYDFSQKTFASLGFQYNAERLANDWSTWPASQVNLESFSLVNLYAKHVILPGKLNFFVAVDNLLNEEYAELYGFNTKGRNIRAGFQLKL